MTLEDAYYVSQIVAAVAILASLIYAGLQFRIFAKQAREARLAAATSDIQQFRHAIVTDRDVARIDRDGLEGLEKLDELDQWRFGAMMQNLTSNFYLSMEFGDASPVGFTEESLRWIVSRPGYRAWWSRDKHMYPGRLSYLIERTHAKADAKRAQTEPKEQGA
jgi:hypothetical protein